MLLKVMTVVGLGFFELWVAIPAGTALNLPPVLTGLASALGSTLGALAVIVAGDRLRNRLLRKKEAGASEQGWIYKVW